MTEMTEEEKPPDEQRVKFVQLARALFRVGKRDVEKHEPKKRAPAVTPQSRG